MPVKYYPITNAQKIHFFTQTVCPKKQLLNIGVSVTIELDVDFDALKQSIYEAYDRNESMRIRFHLTKDNETVQYIAKKEDRDIQYFDFRHWKEEDGADEMRRWTEIPFERYDSPMNKIIMIDMPQGYKGLYFLVDHMTADAQSLIVFLEDIIRIYCAKKYDEEYPKPLKSYVEQLKKDLEYENNSKQLQKDREFWTNEIKKSEPIYADIFGNHALQRERFTKNNPKLRAATSVTTDVTAGIKTFHLEADASKRLMDFCAEYHVPPVCLLLMGLRTYISKVNNKQSDISIQSTISRRATLLEKKSGGTRIHFFPCRTIVNTEDSFLDGLEKMREAQNKNFRHSNFNPLEVFGIRQQIYNLEPGQGYEPLSLTYQPLSRKSEDMPDVRYKSNWYSNGVAAQALYLTVMHRPEDDGLDFDFEYQKIKVTPDQLELIYYYLCKIMFYGIEHPYASVGEIIDAV